MQDAERAGEAEERTRLKQSNRDRVVTTLEATELLLSAYLNWAYRLLEEARIVVRVEADRKATTTARPRATAGRVKMTILSVSPGNLASLEQRMAESRGWLAFVWRGVYVCRARGVGVQMRVAYGGAC